MDIQKRLNNALCEAAWRSDMELVRLLVDLGADATSVSEKSGANGVHYGVLNCNVDEIKFFFEHGVDINAPVVPTEQNKDYRNLGNTPLYIACCCSNEMIEILISLGADVNVKCHGSTPLHLMASKGHLKYVMLLLECGADYTALDKDGNTPFMCAYDNKHKDVAAFIRDKELKDKQKKD